MHSLRIAGQRYDFFSERAKVFAENLFGCRIRATAGGVRGLMLAASVENSNY
jgi:hypothetical protein